MFTMMFDKVMKWAEHRYAVFYLSALSVIESALLPVPPPDVMLAPMSLARPDRAWSYAMLTTLTSVFGGILGYLLGMFAFELIEPLIHKANYWSQYEKAQLWFQQWGIWVVFLAGFSPIPYKLFTISAGVASMAFLPFVIASMIGRGARFYLVAAVMLWGGENMQLTLRKYIDRIGWLLVVVVVIAYWFIKSG
ncbi:MAG: YqaA family protein [Thioalkalispiraceae bacterium]|jgi:membrane protein YqaA with SNARE-associated domain